MTENNGYFGDGGFFLLILFLFAFAGGWGGNGYGNQGAANNYVLASDFATIQRQLSDGFGVVEKNIDTVRNGLCDGFYTEAQLVNGVNTNIMQGVNTLQGAIKDCCCQTQQNIIKMGYDAQINNLMQSQLIQNGFCQVGYEAAQNANGIRQAITDQTLVVTNKIDALESARKDREINALTAQLATVNARAERAAELAPIIKTLEEIKSKQPSTATVQYPNLVGIPSYMLYGAGIAAGAAAGVFGVGGNSGGIFG